MKVFYCCIFLVGLAVAKYLKSDANIYGYAREAEKAVKRIELIKSALQHSIALKSSEVCYDYIGCFHSNGTFSYIWSLPSSPDEVQTSFLLYTRKNPTVPDFLDYRSVGSLQKSHLERGKPLKVICHGFGGSSKLDWVQDMKNAFLETEDVQVIVIDWSRGAATPNYLAAVPNTELVGRQMAVLLHQISTRYGVEWSQMHVIGFSMGAQVVGFVGKSTQSLFSKKIARLTALDAASPLFEGYGTKVHVNAGDAEFVDSIHTNADNRIYAGVGMKEPIGHVDFYPNGGRKQPGCQHNTIVGFISDLFTGRKERECHHKRAVFLFIESIRCTNCSFLSYPCENYEKYEQNECFVCTDGKCGKMGYRVEGLGSYYTTTTDRYPFCTFPLLLAVKSSRNQNATYGQLMMTLHTGDGYSETHNLTQPRTHLVASNVIMKQTIASPKMKGLKKIEVTFQPFNGYFRKGASHWTIDDTLVMKPNGPLFSSCGLHLQLEDSQPQTILPSKCYF